MGSESVGLWSLLFPQTIMLSGGFDPVHIGHIRMIQDAAAYGDVVIILNSDEWLMRKKGFVFMSWSERAEVLNALRGVSKVIPVDDTDGTVCRALEIYRPDYFGNGGDRTDQNTPEKQLCQKLNIEMVWGLGGGKIQSSSSLIKGVKNVLDE